MRLLGTSCWEQTQWDNGSARKPFTGAQAYLATVLGVLGVLGVLVRPPENEIPSGQLANPQWHSLWTTATDWERRHLGGA